MGVLIKQFIKSFLVTLVKLTTIAREDGYIRDRPTIAFL